MTRDIDAGRAAFSAGVSREDNPHIIGRTSRGSLVFDAAGRGEDWDHGYTSAAPARLCTDAENRAAATVDAARFGKRRALNWRTA